MTSTQKDLAAKLAKRNTSIKFPYSEADLTQDMVVNGSYADDLLPKLLRSEYITDLEA